MSRQFLIHAGFHKTGTSSIQATLAANGPSIWPTHALVLPRRIHNVLRVATLHSVTRGPMSLAEFEDRLEAFLHTLKLGRKRGLILSAEDLAGLIPGRRNHTAYDACPDLMLAVESAIFQVFGEDVEMTFFFGLRDKASWLQSAYWQNIRSSRLTDDFETFSQALAGINLASTAEETASALTKATVETFELGEVSGARFGPATPILSRAHLRDDARAALTPQSRANPKPPQTVVDGCLALNRSAADDDMVTAQKAALLQSWRPVSKSGHIT